jgi:hypothetical protein
MPPRCGVLRDNKLLSFQDLRAIKSRWSQRLSLPARLENFLAILSSVTCRHLF